MSAEFDPTALSINEQAAFLLEDTYFADEAQGLQPGGLREQMAAELKAKLERSAKLKEQGKADWPLRVYLGADPTRTSLHIGHMVPVARMRKFQQLGHQVIFLIGDYTAMIGDPTDQAAERTALTHDDVMERSRFFTDQAHRLLHPDTRTVSYGGGEMEERGVEVRYNGEWLSGLGFAELAEIAAQFSLNRIIARDDFRKRMEDGGSVSMHETFYALMQGYDAFALNCDVQIGGYDQHLNLLAGRELQRYFEKKFAGGEHPLFAEQPQTGGRVKGAHVMVTAPLLMGTDGRKMSKSWGNTIDVLNTPEDMFGKVMRISDEMIAHYIDVAIDARPAEKHLWKIRAADEPMAVKKWIAEKITAMYNGEDAARRAEEHFRKTVQEKTVDASALNVLDGPNVVATVKWKKLQDTLPRKFEIHEQIWEGLKPDPEMQKQWESLKPDPQMQKLWEGLKPGPEMEKLWESLKPNPEMEKLLESLKPDPQMQKLWEGLKPGPEMEKLWESLKPNPEMEKLWESLKPNPEMEKLWESLKPNPEMEKLWESLKPSPEMEKLWEGFKPSPEMEQLWQRRKPSPSLDKLWKDATDLGSRTLRSLEEPPTVADLIVVLGFAPSKKEAQRLIEQGGVTLNDVEVRDKLATYHHAPGTVLQVGKRKMVKLV